MACRLTRIQHAALFDVHQIEIDPDFPCLCSDRLLKIHDSPFLELGLKGIALEGQSTGRDGLRTVPIATGWRFVSRVIRERGIVSISIGLRRMRSKKTPSSVTNMARSHPCHGANRQHGVNHGPSAPVLASRNTRK
jgi:hypothetical protein